VFAGLRRICDVGGGLGTFPLALAKKYPDAEFTILELKNMARIAEAEIAEQGLKGRVRTHVMSFFKGGWPKADAFFFSNIFHDWSPAVNQRLARHALRALPPKGKIILHEMLLDENRVGPHEATGFSLCMVCVAEGKQYTRKEITGLLTGVGFKDVRFHRAH